jgi:hypothetical protein
MPLVGLANSQNNRTTSKTCAQLACKNKLERQNHHLLFLMAVQSEEIISKVYSEYFIHFGQGQNLDKGIKKLATAFSFRDTQTTSIFIIFSAPSKKWLWSSPKIDQSTSSHCVWV